MVNTIKHSEWIDCSALQQLQDIMADDFNLLIEVFISDCDQRMVDLRLAAEQQDSKQICALAHGFKGSALNLSAVALTQVCKQLEDNSRENDLTQLAPLMAQLEQSYQQTKCALQALL